MQAAEICGIDDPGRTIGVSVPSLKVPERRLDTDITLRVLGDSVRKIKDTYFSHGRCHLSAFISE